MIRRRAEGPVITRKPESRSCFRIDGGRTYDLENQAIVWDALGEADFGEKADDPAFSDMATFGYGRPDVQVDADDILLVSFWATRACIVRASCCRLRVE